MEQLHTNPSAEGKGVAAARPWWAVAAAGLATFSVVTTEMLPVGLLTPIAETLGSSVGTAGLMLSVPALLAAFCAPLVVLLSGGIDRRKILCGLLFLLILANLASALAPTIEWLLAARVIVGFCMGGIWAIAGGLASRLVPAHSIGLATSIIFGGVAAASVLGVPLGSVIGDFAGWRVAFGAMALLSGLVLLFSLISLPMLPVDRATTVAAFAEQAASRRVQLGLAMTFLIVAGHFMAFTFVRPLLQSVAGVDDAWIGALLFAYGAAGIAGNFLAGAAAARQVGFTLLSIAACLGITLVLFRAAEGSSLGGAAILVFWGIVYGGVSVSLQTWMVRAAPAAVEVATSLFVAVFNIGIASGAFFGGRIVDGEGLQANLLLAAALPVLALVPAVLAQRDVARRDVARSA